MTTIKMKKEPVKLNFLYPGPCQLFFEIKYPNIMCIYYYHVKYHIWCVLELNIKHKIYRVIRMKGSIIKANCFKF